MDSRTSLEQRCSLHGDTQPRRSFPRRKRLWTMVRDTRSRSLHRSLHEASTPDVLSGGPTWSGLYGPVSWLIFFQFEPHGLVRSIQRESSRVAPMEIRPPGFLIRGWSQEMWFGPLLGLGCVDSTDGAEQTDGRDLPPERPRWESNPRPPTCRPSALPTELVERVYG